MSNKEEQDFSNITFLFFLMDYCINNKSIVVFIFYSNHRLVRQHNYTKNILIEKRQLGKLAKSEKNIFISNKAKQYTV